MNVEQPANTDALGLSPGEPAAALPSTSAVPVAASAAAPALPPTISGMGEEYGLSGAAPALVQVPGYEVLGPLGTGGMGAVLRARDPELGRELAVKVLLEEHQNDARMVERFREEAQVGGQLQHPGVVPVYEAGRLPDHRPYFTMKLVEGRTLAALLQERDAPASDLPHFLHIFGQVCQAIAYAHSKGVIHRDLKPANIMVGAFGEVQVMDWGLAKVVKAGDVQTIRSEAPEAKSVAGVVLGTPSYMAPEQACGAVEGLDARCDVFGLGAMLCEILTGAPPYRGRDKSELLRQAARADLADAHARLDGCAADAELVRLTKACLTAEPGGRPADGAAVATAIMAYLAGAQERVRQAELGQAAAQARAAEERKRRRLTVALAATVLLTALGAGAAALWVQQDRAARADADARRAAVESRRQAETERDVTAALDEAAALGRQARTLTDDPAKWQAALTEALATLKRADGLLKNGGGAEELRARAAALRQELEGDDRDRRMVARLEEARLRFAEGGPGGFDRAGAAALYAAAFKDDGTDLDSLDPEQAGERIRGRAIRDALLAGLDDWIYVTPAAALDNLGRWVFYRGGGAAEAMKFLREANERRPGDFWITFDLGLAANQMTPRATGEAVRYYTAAIALRPTSAAAHQNLGGALYSRGRPDEAVAEYRKAIALNPRLAHGHANLGNALLHVFGRDDEAIAEFHKHLEINPNDARTYLNLGVALRRQGRFAESLAAVRGYEAVRPPQAGDAGPSAALRRAEELARANALLPAVLAGAAEPAAPQARVRFAEVCLWTQRCRESARFYAQAFTDEPQLAEVASSTNRHDAARAAALVGCGVGEDAAGADAAERGRWRKQALAWLRADLDLLAARIAGEPPEGRAADARMLRSWQEDHQLAGVRDTEALARLPDDERQPWEQFWSDVRRTLDQAVPPSD